MNLRTMIGAVLVGGALVLGGCATPGYPPPGAYAAPRVECGIVEGIDAFRGAPASSGAGAVLGHQIGGGTGNTVATIAGAVGGAVVGNEIEKNNNANVSGYRVRVRT